MISITDEVLALLETKDSGVYEIAGMPESGSTSACLAMLGRYIESGHDDSVAAICFAFENTPDKEYIRTIMNSVHENIINGFYSSRNTNELLMVIKGIQSLCDVIIIDDFYNVLLYKKYSFIRDFMRALRYIAAENGIKIFFVNQYRYVVKNDVYCFDTDEEFKTLYWEHLEQYVDGRLVVTKDEENNISMAVKEVKKRVPKTSLENLLDLLD